MTGGTAFVLHVQPSTDFGDRMRRMGRIDKVLSAELGTSIRDEGKATVALVQDRVRSGTYVTNVGTRAGIAKGIRFEMVTTTKTAGGRIVASPDALPDERKVMVAAWQKTSFKHPAFGDKGVMVDQAGRPYFFATITSQQPRLTSAVEKAMQRAAATVGGGN